MCWQAGQSYPCDNTSPRRARTFCAEQFTAALGTTRAVVECCETAQIVTSELMTNTLNAYCTRSRFTISFHSQQVRLAVADDAPGEPTIRRPGPTDEHGRGLQIVSRLATRWGVDPAPEGKQVWVELALPEAVTESLVCNQTTERLAK